MNPDFSLLYSQLDLAPGCTLEQFRSAYVRRIAELHPDRAGSTPLPAEAQATLRELVSTYVAVTRFHRRYGRMPGGSPAASAVNSPLMTTMHPHAGTQDPRISGRRPALQDAAGTGMRNPMMTAMRPALHVPVHAGNDTPRHSSRAATFRLVLIIFTLGLLLAGWDLADLPIP